MNILEKIDNYLNEDPVSDMLKDFESAKFKKIVNSLPSKDKKNMQKYVKDAIRMATSKDDYSMEFMKLVPKIMDIFDRNDIDIFNENIDNYLKGSSRNRLNEEKYLSIRKKASVVVKDVAKILKKGKEVNYFPSEKEMIKELVKIVNKKDVIVNNKKLKMTQVMIDAIWDEWERFQFLPFPR